MNFEFEYIKVTLKPDEAWTIMFALLHEVFNEHSIKTHWVFHGVNSMLESQKHQMALSKSFCISMGRPDLFDHYKDEAIKKLEVAIKGREPKEAV